MRQEDGVHERECRRKQGGWVLGPGGQGSAKSRPHRLHSHGEAVSVQNQVCLLPRLNSDLPSPSRCPHRTCQRRGLPAPSWVGGTPDPTPIPPPPLAGQPPGSGKAVHTHVEVPGQVRARPGPPAERPLPAGARWDPGSLVWPWARPPEHRHPALASLLGSQRVQRAGWGSVRGPGLSPGLLPSLLGRGG